MRDGDYVITDRQSTHGTFVNGRKVTEQALKAGDRITFGQADLEIVFEPGKDEKIPTTGMSLFGFGRPEATGKSPLVELEGLSLFLDAARKLSSSRVVDDVLVTLLDTTLRLTKANRGFVYRVDDAGVPHLVTGRDTRGRVLEDDAGISRSILLDAAKSSSRFLVTDTSRMADLASRGSIMAHDLRSVICIPLFRSTWTTKEQAAEGEEAAKKVQGLLYLDSNFVSGELNKTSEDVLTSIATEASALLENARLVEAEQIAQVNKRELEIASDIQQQLMAVAVPDIKYATVEARSIACKNVGGDFYDVVQTAEGLAVVLVDVSGKGVSSALLASTLQGVICSQLESGVPLVQIAGWVDKFIAKKGVSGKYATMVIARIDPTGKLEYMNCGHVPGALLSDGTVRLLESSNVPVGLLPGGKYASEVLQMKPGDSLVIVSDGVTEAGSLEEEFGLEGLQSALRAKPSVDGIFEAVTAFVKGRGFDDDCTALFARYVG